MHDAGATNACPAASRRQARGAPSALFGGSLVVWIPLRDAVVRTSSSQQPPTSADDVWLFGVSRSADVFGTIRSRATRADRLRNLKVRRKSWSRLLNHNFEHKYEKMHARSLCGVV